MRSAVLLCFVAAHARKPSYDEQLSSSSSTFAAECTREKLDQYAVPGAPAVRDLLQPYLKMSPMGQDQRVFMLSHLKRVLDARVPGAVLELGAREGGTSLLFRRMLDAYDPAGRSGRGDIHVYDSFAGFGKLGEARDAHMQHVVRTVRESPPQMRRSFADASLTPPHVHAGFFGNISDSAYPEQIAFAFFDGDLYQSITDSFAKVLHKMSPGGTIVVHDFAKPDSKYPGARRATLDYLARPASSPWRVRECFQMMAAVRAE